MTRPHVLLLGGTAEARALAAAIPESIDLTISLAGLTRAPRGMAGLVRTGGFGGPEALAEWLRANEVAAVVDATHPFAAMISRNVSWATQDADVSLLHLQRPPWQPDLGALWEHHFDIASALCALPETARPFLSTGKGSAPETLLRPDLPILLRAIEATEVPANVRLVRARPPFSEEQEIALMREHAITHLVTKNSGGVSGRTKLTAAQALGLTVVMIERPALPEGALIVTDVDAARAWLASTLALDTSSNPAP
ncbi:precorrin-6A/cobalt-precorrin-6A reductase [Aliiruegeria haliotis]|uniref:Precorrin-6A/cobalt-precorrin-6A reductase n=1 Tax=Aliiruegeria haliotis TaxID=1280846 RepID=A0A2T0RYT4_9RHOB|nr:cobalt-precorrin-6A reductase [Aliiruegeria haliotis]PRY26193.1 precorrin-6A/cobalt-precorrin-6A reductase [Aliiruegeria haliotis]